jgi:dTMP kinase
MLAPLMSPAGSSPQPARFVVVEGIDGAGSTTQSHLLSRELGRRGLTALVTHEPSQGPVGRLLRAVIERRETQVSERTMALLFAGDRVDHLEREVLPALEQGQWVISDRYYHSSLAYQGGATSLPWVLELNAQARRPDVTYILALPVDLAAGRRRARQDDIELYDERDVQRRVAAVYARLPELLPGEPIVMIDGSAQLEQVTQAILDDLVARGWLGPIVST